MKRATKSFGHIDPGYGLHNIFRRAASDFHTADSECAKTESDLARLPSKRLAKAMLEASTLRWEAAIVAVVTACTLLEATLYAYAVTFVDSEEYEKKLDRKGAVEKWIAVPKQCQNKIIERNDPAILQLERLIEVRNAIIHPKRLLIKGDLVAIEKSRQMSEDLLVAVRKIETTVSMTIQLLR